MAYTIDSFRSFPGIGWFDSGHIEQLGSYQFLTGTVPSITHHYDFLLVPVVPVRTSMSTYSILVPVKNQFVLYACFAPYSAELCLSILPFTIATIYNIKYIYRNAYYHVYNHSMQF